IASGPAETIKPYIEGVHQLLRARLCSGHAQQYAIKAALEGPQDHLPGVRAKLRRRRDLTMQWARSTPHVSCVEPQGAFYAFPQLHIPEDDKTFVTELLRQKHVLFVHGSGFGQAAGTRHARIVFLPGDPALPATYKTTAELFRERNS